MAMAREPTSESPAESKRIESVRPRWRNDAAIIGTVLYQCSCEHWYGIDLMNAVCVVQLAVTDELRRVAAGGFGGT
jgi:hypothetical protein